MTATTEQTNTASVENLASAQLLSLYWCCLLLTIELRQTAPELKEAWTLAEVPVIDDAQIICRNIFGVVAMFLNVETGWFGTNLAACPLLLIHDFLQRHRMVILMEEEVCMLRGLMETVKGKILAVFIGGAIWARVATLPIRHDFYLEA